MFGFEKRSLVNLSLLGKLAFYSIVLLEELVLLGNFLLQIDLDLL